MLSVRTLIQWLVIMVLYTHLCNSFEHYVLYYWWCRSMCVNLRSWCTCDLAPECSFISGCDSYKMSWIRVEPLTSESSELASFEFFIQAYVGWPWCWAAGRPICREFALCRASRLRSCMGGRTTKQWELTPTQNVSLSSITYTYVWCKIHVKTKVSFQLPNAGEDILEKRGNAQNGMESSVKYFKTYFCEVPITNGKTAKHRVFIES